MQRGTPSGTATSAAPSRGTSLQPSRRAARAGYSAVRSGDEVKIALSTSSGWKPFASWSARNSSAVASRIAWPVLAGAVVAPRSPRRVLLMALAGQLRLMVITDAGVLKGRDPVEACRRATAGGATMIQVRLKDAPRGGVGAGAGAVGGARAGRGIGSPVGGGARGGRARCALQLLDALDGGQMLGVAGREDVLAVGLCHEVQERHVGGIERCEQAGAPRLADGARREPGVQIRVVG